MRWIEIDLTATECDDSVRNFLEAVRDRQEELPRLQTDLGIDSPLIVRFMAEQGQRLFHAIQGHVPDSFSFLGQNAVGLHLRVHPRDLSLPWNFLHDGLHFLLERVAVCASPWPLEWDNAAPTLPWIARCAETRLTNEALGTASVSDIARRFRPDNCAAPEVLFLSCSENAAIRSYAGLERDTVGHALATPCGGDQLATLHSGTMSPTPADIVRRGSYFQAFHYSASTQRAPATNNSPEINLGGWSDIPETGQQLEAVGVDPVDALIDEIESMDRTRPHLSFESSTATLAEPVWQLEDGHLRPEDLAQCGATPAFVFSNSYLSLPSLAGRFLDSGASAFLGTQALISVADARAFTGDFYKAMSLGLNTAAAQRQAALDAMERRGADHPLWLSYGLVGAGELALQYL